MASSNNAGGRPSKPMSSVKRTYLVAYNALSAALWSVVLVTTAQTLASTGPKAVYPAVGEWTKWTQTLAGLEVVHSVLGIVRAPLVTTLMQVASRFALVWGAVHSYPTIATSPAYSSMLLAWSTTEVIRYAFFALSLSGLAEPPLLQWLRYSGFYVLYPVGISSELWELFLAFGIARAERDVPTWVVIAVIMATYLPGAPKLYGHMMRQRRKELELSYGAS
ncbi:PTPLA-domain-containing protein [Cryphonectria parasitica EP155]|uniref:Very-long-chain (3R)-3-hydroxyacyl-CoA dehydratase n=1 Tax=Cryphonectria parasitica (strain ATCC 38755 / EP155) TaxID=660469 RepID=A0A9P4YBE9_CRYP1|nr:PTPLA-domain-containing protein [Cryphonectria parasitica EP155]KAF3770377.1 PTPLA-domain-containing protein [Cryphonectria parasitica EP155]